MFFASGNAELAVMFGGPHKWIVVLNVILIVLSHGLTVISAVTADVNSE